MATEVTSSPVSVSTSSLAPFNAVITSAPLNVPHCGPVRKAAAQVASVLSPDCHLAGTASGKRDRSVIGTDSS